MKTLIIAPVPLDGKNTHLGGGVSFSYISIIELLKKSGHEVRYLSPWHNLEPMHIKLYPGFRDINFSKANLCKIENEIAWADKVLIPDSSISFKALQIAQKLNTPSVLCNHTDCFKLLATTARKKYGLLAYIATNLFLLPILSRRMKLLAKCSSLFLTTTKANRDQLSKLGVDVHGLFDNITLKTLVFKKKDDPEEIQRIREDLLSGTNFEKIILFAGRIAYEKRISLLFEARPDNALLVIVGDGPASQEVQKHHAPSKGILFLNKMLAQEELRKVIKATDLTVSASDFETLGMAVYETWLCGNKSVVQNSGGFIDQIKGPSYGKLVDYDNPKLAKQAITEILADKTPLATEQALPQEKCIEKYLIEATSRPQVSKSSEWLLSIIDRMTLIFVKHQNRNRKLLFSISNMKILK